MDTHRGLPIDLYIKQLEMIVEELEQMLKECQEKNNAS